MRERMSADFVTLLYPFMNVNSERLSNGQKENILIFS